MLSEVTFLISTYNRPAGLRRLLFYFANEPVKLNGARIIVMDSSESDIVRQNAAVCLGFESTLTIEHQKYPETTNPVLKWRSGIGSVSTKYTLFCADDDFPILSTVSEGVRFLNENPDYAACHGFYLSILRYPDGFHLSEESFNLGREESTPEQRIWSQFEDYAHITYSLRRTGVWTRTLERLSEFVELLAKSIGETTEGGGCMEMADAILCLLEGKVKRLKRVQTIRNGAETSENGWKLAFVFGPHFSKMIVPLLTLLTDALSKSTGRSPVDCELLLKSILAKLFAKVLSQKKKLPSSWNPQLTPVDKDRLRKDLEDEFIELFPPEASIPKIVSLVEEFPLSIDLAIPGTPRPISQWDYLLTGTVPLYPDNVSRNSAFDAPFVPGALGFRRDGWCSQFTRFRLRSTKPGNILTFKWLATASQKKMAVVIQVSGEPSLELLLENKEVYHKVTITQPHEVTEVTLTFEAASPISSQDLHICSALIDFVKVDDVPPTSTHKSSWW